MSKELKAEDKIIKDAQYRKGLSIAFFNATNSAIALVTTFKEGMGDLTLEERITSWRDFFLDEHKTYYANVIAQVGSNYNTASTIAKLQACKTYEEASACWLSLSEDERRDGDVLKAKIELKKLYAKT